MDGWTDITKLTVAFRNFANMPKITTYGFRDNRFFVLNSGEHSDTIY